LHDPALLSAEAGAGSSIDSLAADLKSLFQQHQRLVDLAAEGKKPGKGKKVEGLTQVRGPCCCCCCCLVLLLLLLLLLWWWWWW
jgi:hypothetical protein